jgi:phospholipid/cholesterol/gamma-HCH transport system substrate-binding protein
MQSNAFETLVGAVVVIVAAGFLFFAYHSTNAGGLSGYEISAKLGRVDGLANGTDVRLSGIKIGTVSKLELDPKTYQAEITLRIHEDVKLPEDSSLMVTSSGLLGNQYVSITPGGSDVMLKPGGVIANTQGSVDVMSLVGRFIGGDSSKKAPPPPSPAPTPGNATP